MKYEIGAKKPENLKEYWPGQYYIFSHFEYVSGVPHALFLITSLKENGKVNACYHSWSAFSGDGGGFFAVMPGLMQHTHTYKNILREKEFCVNFLRSECDTHCLETIQNNSYDIDELEAAGLTPEQSKEIKTPRIKEAFQTFECRLENVSDLSGKGISALIIGRVVNAAIDSGHKDIQSVADNFTYNIHAPKDILTGEGEIDAFAKLEIYRR